MKIPTSLKIGGHIIKVVLTDDISDGDQGEFDADTNTIKIRKALAPSRKEVILIHEMLHAMNDTFGYEDANVNSSDHKFLDSMAHQLHQALKDNKLYFG